MIMKRTLFIMVLLMGAIATFTQEEKSGVVDQLLHEQAVKALENRSFIIRFYSNSEYDDFDDRYCFLEVDGEKVSYQFYDGRADREPWTGVTHAPVLYHGTASDFSLKNDDNGDTHFTALLKIPYIYRDFWWNIVLLKDSNECIVTRHRNTKGGYKYKFIGFFKGKLFPIGGTTVMKGEIRR